MSRSLLLLVAVFLMAGCSYSIQGEPVAEPLPPGPAVATPRKTANIDPCTLITDADLKSLGTPKYKPTAQSEKVPNSCLFVMNEDVQVMIAVPYRSFDESKNRQKGSEVQTLKHATWLSCGPEGDNMVCTATIATSRNESLLVAINKKGVTALQATNLLEPVAQTALKRLPAAS
ncbi:hypothetical protein BBK82_04910 [Lentzea guizhouensis]|uniref:DUF3558 domain-containing protein n=1 Tax=Lentzea guizhouensis TaxID=1586287 RepID=A0A1B2HCW0_9PSEU|nr:DUF3558 family protein [Lentzea guizhouensis]ANZ35516.1 hypothetical protein BBK82_04910 [Lentzea guizhouensis]